MHQYYADAPAASTGHLDAEHVAVRETSAPFCPYRGLETFRVQDSAYFAGRDSEISEIDAALDASTIVGVIAASGAGKSSLIYAGVIPALNNRTHELWDIFAFKPGRKPLKSLSRALASADVLKPQGDIDQQIKQINRRVRNFRSGDVHLRDLVEQLGEARQSESALRHRTLIFVDQWEELYTQVDDSNDRDILLREFKDVAECGVATILLTMRADFMGEMLSQDLDFFERLEPGIHYLKYMSEENLRAVIKDPANAVGLTIPDGLTELLIEESLNEPGSLPYLEFTLRELWERRDKASNALTISAYEVLGGLRGAIGKHAHKFFNAELTETERSLARAVLPRLVHVSGQGKDLSIRQPLSDFGAAEQALLRKLAGQEGRLVVFHGNLEAGPEAVVVEIAHEAVLRDWSDLRGWVTEREGFLVLRGRLDSDAARWEEALRDPQYLIATGKQLLDAKQVLQDARPGEISDGLKAYVDASSKEDADRERRERENAQRQVRLYQWFTFVAVFVSVVLGGLGYYSYLKTVEADSKTIEAKNNLAIAHDKERSAVRNESAALTALANSAFDEGRISDAAKLALAAWPRTSTDARPTFKETLTRLSEIPPVLREKGRLVGHTGTVRGALYSPDATRILTWSEDNTARLWDAGTGAEIAVLKGHESLVRGALYSPDATRILTWSHDNTARLWDAGTGAEIVVLKGHESLVRGALYSPDATRILTWSGDFRSRDNTARLWDAGTGAEIAVLKGHEFSVKGALYSPDATRILTWSEDNTARLWDAGTGAEVVVLKGHESFLIGALYSPDATRILTWSGDNTARLWDAGTGAEIAILKGHEASVNGALYSPDATRILTWSGDFTSNNNTARLWDAGTGAEIAILKGHEASVNGALYSPDATRILTWSRDNTARLWDAGTGAEIAILKGHEASVNGALYSPDATRILTWSGDFTSSDNTARLWDANQGPPGNLFEVLCFRLYDTKDFGLAQQFNIKISEPICENPRDIPSEIVTLE